MSEVVWHSLLARQLRRLIGDQPIPDEWRRLLDAVNQAYFRADADRLMLERSLDLSSQELLQANRDLRAIFDLLPDMFFRVSGDGVILDCNLGGLSGSGHPPELRGRRLQEAPPACAGTVLAPLLERARLTHERQVHEVELRTPGGERHAEVSIIPLHAEEFVIFVRDISARHRAEAEGRRLAAAVEQAADAVVVTDLNGNIQYVNPAFEHILGYSRGEVIGQTPALLKSGRHDGAFYQRLWEAVESGRVWKGRFTDRRKDDTLVELNTTISPIRDRAGKITNFVAVSHDVTREVDLEDQLRQAQKMEAIGRLAGGIAHDFNNLLTSMMGNADLILRRLSPSAPVREDVEQIQEAAQRAAGLIAQLLAFSRKQVLNPRVVQINDTVANMARMLKRVIGDRVELMTELDPQRGAVRVDPVQLEQVIMNLALNARDAMPQGGQLTIRTRCVRVEDPAACGLSDVDPGLFVELTVLDTGVGMDAKTRARIFEPFFTTKEVGRGTGLGLSTVYGIVRQSGGAIHVESEPGKGSAFSVYLPQARAALATAPGILPEDAVETGGTILVADDETAVRKLVARLLSASGYRVIEAVDGQEAIEILRRQPGGVRLLLTDVVMPRLDGQRLSRLVHEEFPELPVVLMSGHPETANLRPEELNGSPRYVRKPFNAEQLLGVIQKTLAAEV